MGSSLTGPIHPTNPCTCINLCNVFAASQESCSTRSDKCCVEAYNAPDELHSLLPKADPCFHKGEKDIVENSS